MTPTSPSVDHPDIHGRLRRAAGSALLVLLALYLATTGGLVAGVYSHRWRLVSFAGLAVLFGGWFFKRLRGREGPVRTVIDWPITAGFAWYSITAATSLDPRVSWEMVGFLGLHVLWFWVSLDLLRGETRWSSLASSVVIAGVLMATLAITEFAYVCLIMGWQSPTSYRSRALMLNPNLLGAYLCLAFGFVLCYLNPAHSRVTRLARVVAATLLLVAIFLTRSRGAWLNLAVMIGVVVAAQVVSERHRLSRKHWMRIMGAAVLGGVALVVFIAAQDRHASNIVRLETQRVALRMMADWPWLGPGPGMFPRMWLEYRDPAMFTQLHAHAHHLALTFVAETGLVSAALLVSIGVQWGRSAWRQLRGSCSKTCRWEQIGGFAILMGFFAHTQVEYLYDYPLFAAYLLPLVARYATRDANRRRSMRFLTVPAIILAVFTFIYCSITPSYGLYDRALAANSERDWDQAVGLLGRAVQGDPSFSFYRRQRAIAQGVAALEQPPARAQEFSGFSDAFAFSDRFAPDHAYLACLQYNAGDLPAAISEMERAHQLDPNGLRYTFNLGMYWESVGQTGRAQDLYQQVAAREPSVLGASFWSDTAEREAMIPFLAEAALRDVSPDDYAGQGDVLRSSGYPDAAARYYLLQVDTDAPVRGWLGLAELALADQDASTALEKAEMVLTIAPGDGRALLIRARARLLNDEPGAAARDLETASPSAAVLFYRGEAASAQGDAASAERWYLEAIRQVADRWSSGHDSVYAHFVGRRPRMDTEEVMCLDWPFPDEGTRLPAQRLFAIYRQRGDEAALQTLRQMLPYSMRWVY